MTNPHQAAQAAIAAITAATTPPPNHIAAMMRPQQTVCRDCGNPPQRDEVWQCDVAQPDSWRHTNCNDPYLTNNDA